MFDLRLNLKLQKKPSILRLKTLSKGELTPFTRSDEWQFEKLYRREKERNYKRIDGKRVQVEPNFNKLSPQLQDLIRKRFETLNPDGNFDAIELGEKYL